MKTLKLLFGFLLSVTLLTSCVVDEVAINNNSETISLNQVLNSYEIWYVDINETIGYGEVPFLQTAFTLSFNNGVLYANNNLVGIGEQGNGLGVVIGYYNTFDNQLDVDHTLDGFDSFDVFLINNNTIELYNPFTDTSYFLEGYQRSNFDYNFVFYDNIDYFLQEYNAWEKTYTSNFGVLNEFDNEHYLQFSATDNDSEFKSSQDFNVSNVNSIFWDYVGVYNVANVSGNNYEKILTLDYDFLGNETFRLNVIDDNTVELLHAASNTVYEFKGRGYISFLRTAKTSETLKKRKKNTLKKENPRQNKRS